MTRLEIATTIFPQIYAEGFGSVQQAAKLLGIKPEEYDAHTHYPILVAREALRFSDALLEESNNNNNT